MLVFYLAIRERTEVSFIEGKRDAGSTLCFKFVLDVVFLKPDEVDTFGS